MSKQGINQERSLKSRTRIVELLSWCLRLTKRLINITERILLKCLMEKVKDENMQDIMIILEKEIAS